MVILSRGDIANKVRSFGRHLSAENLAPRTVELYTQHARNLGEYLEREGMPTDVEYITREHITEHINDLLLTGSPSNAAMHYRSLQQFFKWCVGEDHITASPMAKLRAPKTPEVIVPVVRADGLKALLATCAGKDFEGRRDAAIISMFVDTPVRRGELISMEVGGVDLDRREVAVVGKGNRQRLVPIGAKTAKALDRYEGLRDKHHSAHLQCYWIGRRGALTGNGVLQMVRRRCAQAGIPAIHPHQFRHTFAHVWRVEGGDDDSLMRIAGWRSRSMLNRYGASAAEERAREVYRARSPLDRL